MENSRTINLDQVNQGNQGMSAKEILLYVKETLEDNNYNYEKQLVGYIVSGDPSYIPRHNNARTIVKSIDRNELIKEMLNHFLEEK